MKALIVVGLQNDLIPPGALAIPGGDNIAPLINQIMPFFDLVAAAVYSFPANHIRFASSHPGMKPLQVLEQGPSRTLLWPTHCIVSTRGADLATGLDISKVAKIFHMGVDPSVDSYSAFFDAGHKRSTGLSEFFKAKGVQEVAIAGMPTNYEIRNTALESLQLGFPTSLYVDATRGIMLRPDDVIRAVEEMEKAGVKIVETTALIGA